MPRRIIYFFTALLTLAHLWAHEFLYRGLLVICGDSDLYLLLAKNLTVPSEDRPNGYPFLLSIFLDARLPLARSLALAVHGLAIYAAYRWWSSLAERRASRWVFLPVIALQFFPLFLFQHSAWLVPDSVALSLWTILFCLILRGKPGPGFLALALAAGLLALLRNGALSFAILTMLYLIWRAPKKLAPALIAAALGPYLLYHLAYHHHRVGAYNFNYIGGRSALARVFHRSSCAEAAQIPPRAEEQALVVAECKNDETLATEEYRQIWDTEALLGRLDAKSGESRAQRNERYEAWAKRAMLLYPGKFLMAAGVNLQESIAQPLSYNFLLQQPPRLGPSCSRFPAELWSLGADQFVEGWREYQINNSQTLSLLDRANEWGMRILSLLAYLFLLVPLLAWRTLRHDRAALLAYTVAATQLALISLGIYYFTRHQLFFVALSFLQFSIFASSAARPKLLR